MDRFYFHCHRFVPRDGLKKKPLGEQIRWQSHAHGDLEIHVEEPPKSTVIDVIALWLPAAMG